jgi:hypothetical protein
LAADRARRTGNEDFYDAPFVVLTNDRRDALPTASGSPALSMEVGVDAAPFVTSWRISF